MAWQLIYTSAPRLLEAGRTGFGTVARHRAVSGMLAASVERFSQFARLPGHDPRRIVHAHRILIVGASTYHVLSCLQDAGSDYTGRTNHIAHHLIAEPREIRALASAGLTPADVLLSMNWRSSWSESPRYLDPSEEVSLASFSASPSRAWASLTGNPASAGILWSREAQKGCYLITPPGINMLELFRESLLVEPSQAWQTRFTTCLEPNDDVADFRWISLSSSSPMRAQVEISSRLVLDLTSPATLPAPPEKEVPHHAAETAAPAAIEPAFTPPAPVPEPTRSPGAAPAAPLSPMGGWSPEPAHKAAKPARSFVGISLIIAALMIVGVAGALLRQNNLQVRARSDYEQKIAKVWKKHRLILDDTRTLLQEQSAVEEGTELLQSHEEFFQNMQQVLHHPRAPVTLSLPAQTQEDLRDLKKHLDEWQDLHASPWSSLQSAQATVTASDILEAFRKWQESRSAKWKQLADAMHLEAVPPPDKELFQSLQDIARQALSRAKPAHDSRSKWAEVFALPGAPQSSSVIEAQRWLKLWQELETPGGSSDAAAQTAASDTSLPEWLRTLATEKKQPHDSKNEPKMAVKADDNPPQKVPEPVIVIEDADSVSATNKIYLYLLTQDEDPAGKIAGLQVSPDMPLFVGTAWEKHLLSDGRAESKNGGLKKWLPVPAETSEVFKFGPTLFAKLPEMIVFSKDGVLTALPEELGKSPDGVRIVARSSDGKKVLFDLRILKPQAGQQVLLPFVLKAVQVEAPELGDLLSRLSFLNATVQFQLRSPLNLEAPWDVNLQDGKWVLSQKQTAPVTNNLETARLNNHIQALQDGIKSLENLVKLVAKGDHNGEAKLKQYNDGIASKQSELAEVRKKLAELQLPKELPKLNRPSGEYTLSASLKAGTEIDICKVQITPPEKTPVNNP